MIITRITGGLGNQMFQYAIAKSIAIKNNDVFKLDVSFYPKQTLRKYELNLFNVQEDFAEDTEILMLRGNEGLLFKVLNKFNINIKKPSSYFKEKQVACFDEGVFNITGNLYLDGYWQNEKYFKDIKGDILRDFTPKDGISNIANKYLEDINQVNSVSLHVRRGDYVESKETNKVHGICNLDYYKKAVDYIEQNISAPHFFIFSDDISWCKENFNFLQNKVFVDDTKSAIEDLILMKRCKHNIIANSTFSWWGAWLNEYSEKIVISPKIWFIANKEAHLASQEWVKI